MGQVVQQVEQQQQIEQELRQKESESAKKSDTSSSSSMAEERKLSKLMNPRGRKVTRMGDYLVFTETSQNGVQQVRGESEDQLRGPGQTGGDGILSAVCHVTLY